ncbi:MAG TPA: GlsB/YeaQ/YmgE family stress response membrane protein [Bacilli bacterium]
MIGLIISIIMAIIIGFIGDAIVKSSMPGGVIGSMVAGFIGAWLGSLLLGGFGPVVGGFAIIPAIIGAALFVFLVGLIFRGSSRSSNA